MKVSCHMMVKGVNLSKLCVFIFGKIVGVSHNLSSRIDFEL